MPFRVVSGVGLGRGVLDFDGDRQRGMGSLGVNTMQKWHIDRLSTCWLGSRKGIRPVKKLSGGMLAWLSAMRCRLAYGPANATATHCLLLQ